MSLHVQTLCSLRVPLKSHVHRKPGSSEPHQTVYSWYRLSSVDSELGVQDSSMMLAFLESQELEIHEKQRREEPDDLIQVFLSDAALTAG